MMFLSWTSCYQHLICYDQPQNLTKLCWHALCISSAFEFSKTNLFPTPSSVLYEPRTTPTSFKRILIRLYTSQASEPISFNNSHIQLRNPSAFLLWALHTFCTFALQNGKLFSGITRRNVKFSCRAECIHLSYCYFLSNSQRRVKLFLTLASHKQQLGVKKNRKKEKKGNSLCILYKEMSPVIKLLCEPSNGTADKHMLEKKKKKIRKL